MGHPFAQQWNHNAHYYPRLAAAVPDSARVVLDIGCGDGTFTRYVRRAGRRVIGVDIDLDPLPDHRERVDHLQASAEALPLRDGSVDAITMIMVLHHVDPERALTEVRRVLRPGGTLALLGYGRSTTPADWLREAADIVSHQVWATRTRRWDPPVRFADPPLSWTENRRVLETALPGGRYRRLPMWRFEYRWTAPTR